MVHSLLEARQARRKNDESPTSGLDLSTARIAYNALFQRRQRFLLVDESDSARMASTTTLGRLFKALGTADIQEAKQIAREIVESEHRRGHRSAAALLRGALSTNGHGVTPIQSNGPGLDPNVALIEERTGPSLKDVILTAQARQNLEDVVSEWKHRHLLLKEGLARRTKALFFGPPGCGKTLAARALGTEMGLPVLTVRFSSVVGAYLGQTGAHFRSVFKFAEANACVLLLDEFDAVGRSRGRSDDVGELDRVVISLLQELDHTVPAGIVIGATNIPKSLDGAIWRRFDLRVEFPAPTRKQIEAFALRKRVRPQGEGSRIENVPRTLHTFADVDNWLLDQRRQRFLRGVTKAHGKAR